MNSTRGNPNNARSFAFLIGLVVLLLATLIVLGVILKSVISSQAVLMQGNMLLSKQIGDLVVEMRAERAGNVAPQGSQSESAAPSSTVGESATTAPSAAVTFVTKSISILTLGSQYPIVWEAPASVREVFISVTGGAIKYGETYSVARVLNEPAEEVEPAPAGTVHGMYIWDVGSTQDGVALGGGKDYQLLISGGGFNAEPTDRTNYFSLSE